MAARAYDAFHIDYRVEGASRQNVLLGRVVAQDANSALDRARQTWRYSSIHDHVFVREIALSRLYHEAQALRPDHVLVSDWIALCRAAEQEIANQDDAGLRITMLAIADLIEEDDFYPRMAKFIRVAAEGIADPDEEIYRRLRAVVRQRAEERQARR